MSGVETWAKVVNLTADCLYCGQALSLGVTDAERQRARAWARRHAEANPGHHVIVETTQGRSYRSPR